MPDGSSPQLLRALCWDDDGLTYVDQRFLPDSLVYARATDAQGIIEAVESSAVAGARCIDAFCAFGVALARRTPNPAFFDAALSRLRTVAITFGYHCEAIDRVAAAPSVAALSQAVAILEENIRIDRAISQHALALFPARGAIVTLGGTGALSTGGLGTAVAAIAAAHRRGKHIRAYVSETRPLLTGMRLAGYELAVAGVPITVFPDGAAAALMQVAPIAAVIVGATAIAANGDAVGEIGTFGLALAAAHHRVPFYVTAPRASVGMNGTAATKTRKESTTSEPEALGPHELRFDRTPGHLIAAIITEYGITRPPYYESLPSLATRPQFELISRRSSEPDEWTGG